MAAEFGRFADERIGPHAERIHREDTDVPESIIDGLREIGAFGMSIPEQFGGMAGDGGHAAMVVATEELSRVSVGVGGSLLTRPEILARALLKGGTDEQRTRLLPGIATGALLVAVAVTEPDAGSDVAAVRCAVTRTPHGWRIDGTKTWCTFAGRADIIMLLRGRTPTQVPGIAGCRSSWWRKSLPPAMPSISSKPAADACPAKPSLRSAIGVCTASRSCSRDGCFPITRSSAAMEGWVAASTCRWRASRQGAYRRGPSDGTHGRRIQSSAPICQGAPGLRAEARRVPARFETLARMGARMVSNRLLTYTVSRSLESDEGALQAAIAKAVSCRDVLGVTSDALQIHGGYGYAEEYPVSRYFVDARVLPVFEGTEEVLALRVIARALVEAAGRTIG